jgi:signal peptidase I
MVIGRAFVVVWPPSHWKILSIPSTFSQPGISKGSSVARRGQVSAEAGLSEVLGSRVSPGSPYGPLAAGVVGGIPLTWLQLRIRRRLRRRL